MLLRFYLGKYRLVYYEKASNKTVRNAELPAAGQLAFIGH